MIKTKTLQHQPATSEEGARTIPTFVQQCDTIEKLKRHLLASSSDDSDSEGFRRGSCGSSSDEDEQGEEVSHTIADLRKRLEAKLD